MRDKVVTLIKDVRVPAGYFAENPESATIKLLEEQVESMRLYILELEKENAILKEIPKCPS